MILPFSDNSGYSSVFSKNLSLSPKVTGMNKTIMITGATSGFGKAIAELFARNGYKLIITGRRSDRLESLKKELSNEFGTQITTLCFDIRDRKAVEQAIA